VKGQGLASIANELNKSGGARRVQIDISLSATYHGVSGVNTHFEQNKDVSDRTGQNNTVPTGY
jgi:hypothetical protein